MKTRIALFAVLAVVLLQALPAAAGEDFVIIVNASNPVEKISKADLKRIYTGIKKEVGGAKAVPINFALESPIAAAFLKGVLGKSPDEYKEFWLAEGVKNGGSAPMIQKSSEIIISLVSQIPGAVGYVEKGKEKDQNGVKTVPIE